MAALLRVEGSCGLLDGCMMFLVWMVSLVCLALLWGRGFDGLGAGVDRVDGEVFRCTSSGWPALGWRCLDNGEVGDAVIEGVGMESRMDFD